MLAPFVGQETSISGITVEGTINVAIQSDGTSALANNPGVWDGTYCGGVVAKTRDIQSNIIARTNIGYIEDIAGSADMQAEVFLGGIAGWSDYIFRDCYYHGVITIDVTPTWYFFGKAASVKAGGICGQCDDGVIVDCANYGKIDHKGLAQPSINASWSYYGGICGKYAGVKDNGQFYKGTDLWTDTLGRNRDDAILRCTNFGDIEVNTYTGGGLGKDENKAIVNFCGGIVGGMVEGITWHTLNACVNYGNIIFHYKTKPSEVGMICGKYEGNFLDNSYKYNPDYVDAPGGIKNVVNYGNLYSGSDEGPVSSYSHYGMIVGQFVTGWARLTHNSGVIKYFSGKNFGHYYVQKVIKDGSIPLVGDEGDTSKNDGHTIIRKFTTKEADEDNFFSQLESPNFSSLTQSVEVKGQSSGNDSYEFDLHDNIVDKPFVSSKSILVTNILDKNSYSELPFDFEITDYDDTLYFPKTVFGAVRVDMKYSYKTERGTTYGFLEKIPNPFIYIDEDGTPIESNYGFTNGYIYYFKSLSVTKVLNSAFWKNYDPYKISWNSYHNMPNAPDGYIDAKKLDQYYDQWDSDYWWKAEEFIPKFTRSVTYPSDLIEVKESNLNGDSPYSPYDYFKIEMNLAPKSSNLINVSYIPILRLDSVPSYREGTLNSVSFQKQTGNVVSNTSDGIAKAELKYERKDGKAVSNGTYELMSYASKSDKYKYKENDLWFLHVTPKVGYAVTAVYVGGVGKEVCVYDGTNMSAIGNAKNVTAAYNEELFNEAVPIVTNLHTYSLQNDFCKNLDLTRKWSNYGDARYGKNNVWLGDFAMTMFVPCDCNGIKLFESIRICYKQITYKTDFYCKNAPNSAFTGVNDDLDYYEPDLTHYDWEQALLPSGILTPLANANDFGFSSNGYLAYIAYFNNGEFDTGGSVTEFELVEGEAFNKMSSMPDYSNYGTITWSDLVGTFVTDITTDQIDLVFIKVPRRTFLTVDWTYNEWNHLEEFLSGDYVGTAEFFRSHDNSSLSANCWADANVSDLSIRIASDTERANAYDCFVYGAAVNYLREDDTIDLQKVVDDIYITNATSNANDFFKILAKGTLARDYLYEENYKQVNFDVQFELRTYTLRGDTIIVNGTGGNVRLAYYTSKNLRVPNAPTPEINTTVMSNANNPIEVYYNAPVILIAEDNEKSPNFAGYYAVVGGNEYLLSTNKEYNFFFEDVMALVSKLYDASSNKDDLHIRAKYGSKAGETEGSVGTQPSKEEGVWQIRNFAELLWVSNQVNSGERTFAGETIKLVSDIDMLNIGFTPIGKDDKNSFQGVFDGQFFHINNLFVANSMDARNCYGLFGYIKNATIKNLIIQSCNVAGAGNVGGLVGYAKNSIIRRVEIYGNPNTVNVGGEDIAFFDIYTNLIDHLIFFNSTGSSSGFPTSINTTMLDGGYIPSYREEEFDGGGGHSGVVGGLVGTSEGVAMVGCSNRGGVNGGGLIGNSLSDTTIDQSFCTSADNLCGEGVATITNSYYGNDIAATYGMSLSGEGIWSSEATLSENSKVWTVMNGHLALKIFYWDA